MNRFMDDYYLKLKVKEKVDGYTPNDIIRSNDEEFIQILEKMRNNTTVENFKGLLSPTQNYKRFSNLRSLSRQIQL